MIMKPRSTEPGPPVWKALPELTNRPAPMAPPLSHNLVHRRRSSVLNLHGNHLHVPALQVLVKPILASCDHVFRGGILVFVLSKRRRLVGRSSVDMLLGVIAVVGMEAHGCDGGEVAEERMKTRKRGRRAIRQGIDSYDPRYDPRL